MLGRAIGVVVVAAAFFVSSVTAAFATADERATATPSASQVPEEGSDFTQNLTVTNDGPDSDFYHFHIEVEPLPWTSLSISYGPNTNSIGSTVQQDPAKHTLDFDVDAGSGGFISAAVTVTPSNRTIETGTVTASTPPGNDPVVSNNSATASTTIMGLTVSGGAFADQLLGTASGPQQLTVTNGSAQPVTLTGRLAGGNWSDFSLSGFGHCSSVTLPTGESCSFGSIFAPTATGLRSATATLAPTTGPVDPASFTLTGYGTVRAAAPVVTLAGLPRTIKLERLEKKGLRYTESANEASAFQNTLIGSAKKVTFHRQITAAKRLSVILAQSGLSLGTGTRTVHLKPSHKLIGGAKKFSLRVQVVATDASGNQSLVTRTIKVR